MTYKDVIEDFNKKCEHYCLSDGYLEGIGNPTRETTEMCGEYQYGMVFVRDDGVELLIERIHELENGLSG